MDTRRICTWRTSEYRYVACPPRPGVYEEIERLIPTDRIQFDPVRNVWRIRGIYWSALKRALVDDCGLGPVEEYQSRADFERAHPEFAEASGAQHETEAYETLFLLPQAPEGVVEAAYRALARLYHPDRGGDPRRMAAINLARDRIAAQ